MPRPKKKRLKLNEETVEKFMQEVYDDSFKLNSRINMLFNTWNAKVKDGGDIAAIGESIIKLITAMGKNQEQKIAILKILKDIVFVNKQSGTDSEEDKINMDKFDELTKAALEELKRDNML